MSVAQPIVSDMIAQAILAEFEQQAPITRRYIERLPGDKPTWKPHEKSMTAGQLAFHLRRCPAGLSISCSRTRQSANLPAAGERRGVSQEIRREHSTHVRRCGDA